MPSLCLETVCYTVIMAYNFCSGYSLLTYLEYPLVLLEMYVFLLLVLYYENRLHETTYMLLSVYFVTTLLVMRVAPVRLLAPLLVIETTL